MTCANPRPIGASRVFTTVRYGVDYPMLDDGSSLRQLECRDVWVHFLGHWLSVMRLAEWQWSGILPRRLAGNPNGRLCLICANPLPIGASRVWLNDWHGFLNRGAPKEWHRIGDGLAECWAICIGLSWGARDGFLDEPHWQRIGAGLTLWRWIGSIGLAYLVVVCARSSSVETVSRSRWKACP